MSELKSRVPGTGGGREWGRSTKELWQCGLFCKRLHNRSSAFPESSNSKVLMCSDGFEDDPGLGPGAGAEVVGANWDRLCDRRSAVSPSCKGFEGLGSLSS